MNKSSFLITLLVLTALALSACGGARGLMFKDISNAHESSTHPIDSTQPPEVQTTRPSKRAGVIDPADRLDPSDGSPNDRNPRCHRSGRRRSYRCRNNRGGRYRGPLY